MKGNHNYSQSKSGKTELVFHRMADTSINPFAASSILNAKLA